MKLRKRTLDSISGGSSKLRGQGTDIAVPQAAMNRQGADHEFHKARSHRISHHGSISASFGYGRQSTANLHGSEN